ncbi:MAG TPA: HypC/HybG/HupF family hydrogenase formation chaperone [Thermomicrobiaceae bacterium]|nr:HypC/HybG/HupF family hydrogenase formation chaperone [Thermomicrobiaceae bacterium]
MCRAVPARVLRIEQNIAWIEAEGRESPVSLLGIDGVSMGDYVFHHAGLALARVEPEEAAAILAAYDELESLYSLDELDGEADA